MDNTRIAVIGLGYVGLPVAVAFAKHFDVIGFDIDATRIAELARGVDRTREVDASTLASTPMRFTADPVVLRGANVFIVTVPTPVTEARLPDLGPLEAATRTVAQALEPGDLVIYESTVYPGLTEEFCVPRLAQGSGLRYPVDFKVGYSPERINPGDHRHRFTTIRKVVAGCDADASDRVAALYGRVVEAGVYVAESIKVAEAAKVIENTQRDLNIALMNELALICDRLGIDTGAVLDAAATKWNFLGFRPGLVGGHCIGVDPYYLTFKAEQLGLHPEVTLAGRRINDSMGRFVAERTVKALAQAGHPIRGTRVTVLGLTFKENCPDLRNTRVIDVVRELEEYGCVVQVCDPVADAEHALREYGRELVLMGALEPAAAIVAAVAHDEFRALDPHALRTLTAERPVLVDVKGMWTRAAAEAAGFRVWRL